MTSTRSPASSRSGAGTSAPRSTTSSSWRTRSATRTTSSRSSSTAPTRCSARSRPRTTASASRSRSAAHARADPEHAGRGHPARQHARSNPPGTAARGARPRSVAGRDAAVPAREHADHPRPDPAVHGRCAADGQGAAPGRPEPRRADAQAGRDVRRPQLRPQRGCLQPARQRRGGLPLLALVGQPHRHGPVLDPGRARPDPPRPVPGLVLRRRRPAAGRRGQPRAQDAGRPPQRAAAVADLPGPGRRGLGGHAGHRRRRRRRLAHRARRPGRARCPRCPERPGGAHPLTHAEASTHIRPCW